MKIRVTSPVVRAGMLLTSGTAAGQLLLFFSSLIIVRLYSPDQIGLFTTLSSVAACAVALSTGRFEQAIPLPASDLDALKLARISILLSVAFATIVALGTLAMATLYPSSPFRSIAYMFWALPALTMGMALFQIASQLAVRAENYKSVSQRAITYPTIAGSLQVVSGIVGFGEAGLVVSICIGQVAAFLAIWAPTSRKLMRSDMAGRSLWQLIIDFKRFPLFLSIAGFLNALGSQLPQILVAIHFGLVAAGQLGITMKVMALPVALIGQSLAYVYNGEIAKRARNEHGSIQAVFDKMSAILAAIGLGLAAVLVFAGPAIFSLLLGDTWSIAGHFASILAVGVSAQLVAAPLSQTLTIAGWLKAQFFLDLLRVTAIALCFGVALQTRAAVETTLVFVTVGMTMAYALIWLVNREAARSIDKRRIH